MKLDFLAVGSTRDNNLWLPSVAQTLGHVWDVCALSEQNGRDEAECRVSKTKRQQQRQDMEGRTRTALRLLAHWLSTGSQDGNVCHAKSERNGLVRSVPLNLHA